MHAKTVNGFLDELEKIAVMGDVAQNAGGGGNLIRARRAMLSKRTTPVPFASSVRGTPIGHFASSAARGPSIGHILSTPSKITSLGTRAVRAVAA